MNENEEKKEKEMVSHPAHYQGNKFEVIDIIEDFDLNFCLGNVIKYILRSDKKSNKLEDLKKAKWYLEREINNIENENVNIIDDSEQDAITQNCYFAVDNNDFEICEYCGKPFIKSISNFDFEYTFCQECFNKIDIDNVGNFIKWHDARYKFPQDGIYNCFIAKIDIMTKIPTYCYEKLEIKGGQHLMKANWVILSWRENENIE